MREKEKTRQKEKWKEGREEGARALCTHGAKV